MSKAITFFRNRQQETGLTYELEIQSSTRPYRVFIYSRKPLEEALVRSRQLRGGSTATDEVDKITQALQRGEGGAIALIFDETREQRALVVIPVASGGKAAFGSVGLLLPGHPALHLEAMSKTGIHFPPGSHALIPVDKEAEEYLRGFQEYIGYLPPDLESLVLHAIRDPSLDVRMGRLEAVVLEGKERPATILAGQAGVAQPWYKRWFKRSVPVWPVAAMILGLMLVVNSLLLYSVLQSVNGSVVLPFRAAPPVAGGGTAAATPEQKIFAVVEAVRGKGSIPRFATLAQGHFSEVQKAEDVASVLARQDDGRLLVRGLMKLEALRQDSTAAGDLFAATNNASQINRFFADRELDEDDRETLAALACAAFPSPELPSTQNAAAVRFAGADETCQSFPLSLAIPGLDELLQLVQQTD